LNDNDVGIFIAEIRKDVQYIKARLDDKCSTYDNFMHEISETRIKGIEKDVEYSNKAVNILWGVIIVGGLLAVFLREIGILK
jgi:hypothetical protein